MNARSKTATQFYTPKHAESAVQISLAGREVGSESVGNMGYANKDLSSRDGQQEQATALHVLRTYRGLTNVRRLSSVKRGRWQS